MLSPTSAGTYHHDHDELTNRTSTIAIPWFQPTSSSLTGRAIFREGLMHTCQELQLCYRYRGHELCTAKREAHDLADYAFLFDFSL